MATVSHMKMSWYIFILIYLLQQVQPQSTANDTTAAVSQNVTTEATTENVTSQAVTMVTTAAEAQNNTNTTGEETSNTTVTTQAPSGGNMTDGNNTADNSTTMASNMSEANLMTTQSSASMNSSEATNNQTHENMTTQGQNPEMTTAAMPVTCYSCNGTDCSNSSKWQTCISTGGCSITYLKASKTVSLSCGSSCNGEFPSGKFTNSECGFCCKGAYCNNYTMVAIETACIKMSESSASAMMINPAAFLLFTLVQMVIVLKY